MISRRRLLGAAAALAPLSSTLRAEESALERVRRSGRLVVAVYQDMPPFNLNGQGVDVDLAAVLADSVGVPLSLLPIPAGESVGDDLRNAVWRGHYLGWGPADVMLHVPMDRPLIEANPQVEVFGAYYRETVMLAWDSERGPAPEAIEALRGQKIAVAGVSLPGYLLASADSGALRDTLSTQHADGVAAARTLLAGDVVAAAGLASELEAALAGKPRYKIVPLPPIPRAPRNGWVVGCAVKRGATDLAQVMQRRLIDLNNGPGLRELFQRHNVVWRG